MKKIIFTTALTFILTHNFAIAQEGALKQQANQQQIKILHQNPGGLQVAQILKENPEIQKFIHQDQPEPLLKNNDEQVQKNNH